MKKNKGRRKNPLKGIKMPPDGLIDGLIDRVSDSVGNMAVSIACDGMSYEHKMMVAAIIKTHIRPVLGYHE